MTDSPTPSYHDIHNQAGALAHVVETVAAADLDSPTGSWLFLGSGASFHAATLAAAWARAIGVAGAAAAPASEAWMSPGWWIGPETTVVGLSRTGTTVETVEALRAARRIGARTIGISCTPDTPLLADADRAVNLSGVDERGRVMTRSFAALALAGQWVVAGGAADPGEMRGALRALPDAIVERVADHDRIARTIAARASEHCVLLGSEPHVAICAQARLQMLETARIDVEAYPVLEYRHGPLAGMTPSTELVLISTRRSLPADRLLEDDVARLGGRLSVCAAPDVLSAYGDAVTRVALPGEIAETVVGNAALPFVQLLAYHLTRVHGRDPESVHNLDRSIEPHVNPHAVDPSLFATASTA